MTGYVNQDSRIVGPHAVDWILRSFDTLPNTAAIALDGGPWIRVSQMTEMLESLDVSPVCGSPGFASEKWRPGAPRGVPTLVRLAEASDSAGTTLLAAVILGGPCCLVAALLGVPYAGWALLVAIAMFVVVLSSNVAICMWSDERKERFQYPDSQPRQLRDRIVRDANRWLAVANPADAVEQRRSVEQAVKQAESLLASADRLQMRAAAEGMAAGIGWVVPASRDQAEAERWLSRICEDLSVLVVAAAYGHEANRMREIADADARCLADLAEARLSTEACESTHAGAYADLHAKLRDRGLATGLPSPQQIGGLTEVSFDFPVGHVTPSVARAIQLAKAAAAHDPEITRGRAAVLASAARLRHYSGCTDAGIARLTYSAMSPAGLPEVDSDTLHRLASDQRARNQAEAEQLRPRRAPSESE